jgi:HEAT repeat protein
VTFPEFAMIRRLFLVLLAATTAAPRTRAADDEPTFRHEPLKKLLGELRDPEPKIRRQAALTLGMPDGTQGKGGPRPRGDLWPAILALVDALKDTDFQMRANSVQSIGLLMRYRGLPEKMDDRAEKVALAVIAALKDQEDLVRSAAAAALPSVGIETKPGVTALAEAMKHNEAKVRAAAAAGATGVRTIGDIVPALGTAVRDSDAAVRLAAANSLMFARAAAAPALKPLVAMLTDADPKVGAAAATALGAMGPAGAPAIPALADVIADQKSGIRVAAVGAVGMIRQVPEIAIPVLIGALATGELRSGSFYALSTFGTLAKSAVPAILGFARDAKGSVRPDALNALASIEPDGFAFHDLLFAALLDPNPFVRSTAVNYCGRDEGVPEALPVLVQLFKVDGNLRTRIAYAFGAMGPDAQPVVPMLLELVGNPETSQQLRRVYINALRNIDPDSVKPPSP